MLHMESSRVNSHVMVLQKVQIMSINFKAVFVDYVHSGWSIALTQKYVQSSCKTADEFEQGSSVVLHG